jgi:predicted DCC family thiol-disulfide oxidoreductase YuxK
VEGAGGKPVIYFDGVCNLCNRYVQFVIKHDNKGQFLFAPLQSENGKNVTEAVRAAYGAAPDSVVLYADGKYYIKADAVLQIVKRLGGTWRLLLAARILPKALRNWLYDMVARNRYRWFGRKQECMVPTPQLKSRFLQ